MKVSFAPRFTRQFKKLDPQLKQETRDKIHVFADNPSHPTLKAHALKGSLKGTYSFSVNYKISIIFEYLSSEEIVLFAIGDHDIYK